MNPMVVTLTQLSCADCGISFAIEEPFRQQRLKDGASFYCPNGHNNYYPKHENELKRLQREKENAVRDAKVANNWVIRLEAEARELKRQKVSIKGQLTKTRNRIANGVCPCCHRTVKQLAEHISSKHPDFKAVVTL